VETVVVLGKNWKRNFAAGMSGGVYYVSMKQFENGLYNMEMVALGEDEDITKLRRLMINHSMYTNSPLAKDA
jgi:glutamate synthase (ferredoxin)